AWFWWPGAAPAAPVNAARLTPAPPSALPDPAQPGAYAVRTLFYGSGADRHRPEWGTAVDLLTTPVNGRAFLSGWTDLRTRYWGFDETALPRNGRVWYPEGAGPFPLVLIVHGNHDMTDFSDGGYAYLGELLASRGYVVVSVDQNFLNGSAVADWLGERRLRGENDARAWLLLEHLRLWRDWQQTAGNPFYQKVDLTRVALIGHSRGGEAVAVAAAFNRLDRYPDNARIPFSYDFGIRAVVAIAPVDGQYRPAGAPTPLHNVSYLVLHGAHDMDVTSFVGQQQFNRATFDAADPGFKASVYVYGANHGQFNSSWGRADRLPPVSHFYNTAQLLPLAAQQGIAQAFISAFLETAVAETADYRPLFQDARAGGAWLPDTVYLTRYADGRVRPVATFDEDVDVTTTTAPGGRLLGRYLRTWREARLPQKGTDLESRAVALGWAAGGSSPATYAVTLPDGWQTAAGGALLFALADAEPDDGDEPIDLSVELRDVAGETAVLPLSHVMPLQPQPVAALRKPLPWDDAPASEPVLQSYALPLADFTAVNPALDVTRLAAVTFRFDRGGPGEVWLDDLGFRP
ncbi:MAG: hypothetical protein KC425_00575, partial [Anaerolineales bacterium]|nr:hypothetical protein [Anaerolineales bacterium]